MNEIVSNGQPNIALYVPEETQTLIQTPSRRTRARHTNAHLRN